MFDPKSADRAGCLIVGGAGFSLISIVVWFVLLGAGASGLSSPRTAAAPEPARTDILVYLYSFAALGGVVLGAGTSLLGILMLWRKARGNPGSERIERLENSQIVAKLAVDRQGNMSFPTEAADCPHDCSLLIQLVDERGRQGEFECSPELYDTVAEGQKGAASIQGRWFSAFEPAPRETGEAPPDPFRQA